MWEDKKENIIKHHLWYHFFVAKHHVAVYTVFISLCILSCLSGILDTAFSMKGRIF